MNSAIQQYNDQLDQILLAREDAKNTSLTFSPWLDTIRVYVDSNSNYHCLRVVDSDINEAEIASYSWV